MVQRQITRSDILPMDAYERVRDQKRQAIAAVKRSRRVQVGPDVTFYFENYDTMWHQIHEMLRIERGGDEQVADELEAYNPLIPDGRNLVATMMIEIDEQARRARVLAQLGGIERSVSLSVDGFTIAAVPESDVERTTASGKVSSVHFLKFPFTADAVAAFRRPGCRALIAISHPHYDHMAALPEAVREALAADFD